MKKCPFCAEEIQDAAIKCRYCGSELAPAQPSAPVNAESAPSATQEHVYFQDTSVTVTNARAIMGGKTYAMANITSVTLFTKSSASAGCGIMLVICGAFLLLFLFSEETRGIGIFGAILATIGFLLSRTPPTYFVRLASSSGEANALEHSDKAYVQKIVQAVSESIIGRG